MTPTFFSFLFFISTGSAFFFLHFTYMICQHNMRNIIRGFDKDITPPCRCGKTLTLSTHRRDTAPTHYSRHSLSLSFLEFILSLFHSYISSSIHIYLSIYLSPRHIFPFLSISPHPMLFFLLCFLYLNLPTPLSLTTECFSFNVSLFIRFPLSLPFHSLLFLVTSLPLSLSVTFLALPLPLLSILFSLSFFPRVHNLSPSFSSFTLSLSLTFLALSLSLFLAFISLSLSDTIC
ncbi:unnamed protein product [Acanthosepion pharaonis]|uniref:Uncharacterized protein n=1 Tax=Acanthosepion pharaonis TaxID=158019 RepID=A0A812AJE2_ACAPH|nr:unnamed protein product [Sepia pharaonis]